MNFVISTDTTTRNDRGRVGGKFSSLAILSRKGMKVPAAICVSGEAYLNYLASTGLDERIFFELHRKNFQEMRWEELWDASLRIRNMFLNTPMPQELHKDLRRAVELKFRGKAVAVRSSAPGEDSATFSFAGLHESYLNITGEDAILDHVRLVWASLWSDRALLYRRELGLRVDTSTMAVIIQEIIAGDRSGVAFSMNPLDSSQAVIEAVYGLNQGLVDGSVEPDRWILDRNTGEVLGHNPAHREKALIPSSKGVALEALPHDRATRPPLRPGEVIEIFELAQKAEKIFSSPQDMEWTFRQDIVFVLQSRPITTTRTENPEDLRPWYLTLRRSFENLKLLRAKIEQKILPEMEQDAARMAEMDLAALSDRELTQEILERSRTLEKWNEIYRRDCIPFAHGMRLFGQVYNDVIRSQDPFEFMELLGSSSMESLERNRMLETMAAMLRETPDLAHRLKNRSSLETYPEFVQVLDAFQDRLGIVQTLPQGTAKAWPVHEGLRDLLLEMAYRPLAEKVRRHRDIETMRDRFLSKFPAEKRNYAEELLDLGRASYRLRDDDNVYLGKVEAQVAIALGEGRRRLKTQGIDAENLEASQIAELLLNGRSFPEKRPSREESDMQSYSSVKARQIVGQPASQGIAMGEARVIRHSSNLFEFKASEVLVCDAVDPNMTFVVPLASAIVERRGGMLIHGAIIAREYGIPCVTGVPNAVSLIKTGQRLTVDGYLGIVIIG